jgi:hypothetical protein
MKVNSSTSSTQCNSLFKNKLEMLYNIRLETFSLPDTCKLQAALLGALKTDRAQQCSGPIVANTNDKHCEMLLNPVVVELVVLQGNKRYVTLFDVNHTRVCFDDCNWTDTNQWRCQNCNCGTRAVTKLKVMSHDNWDYPTEGPRNSSWLTIWAREWHFETCLKNGK